MKNDNLNEHRLDSLLDSEPEEEFGEPENRDRFDHGTDDSISGNLKDWSA